MKRSLYFILLMIVCRISFAQINPPYYVQSGDEYPIYGVFDLAAHGGVWATARVATPGFYSPAAATSYNGYFINASDAHNVNGYVKRFGTGAFTFPVGTGTELRSLSISAPFYANSILATAWIAGDPSITTDPTLPNPGAHDRSQLGANILAVSPLGEWDWMDPNNTSPGITVTVSIPNLSSFSLASNLRMVGWNGYFWADLSGIATASGNTAGSTLSGTMINGITAIAIGTTSSILDVTLSDFSITNQDCNALLNWTTTHEDGSSVFYIEQSNDGAGFSTVAQTSAVNNTNGNSYHVAVSPGNASGTLYYRLKIVSNSGITRYSSVKQFVNRCGLAGSNMVLAPNPLTAGVVTGSLRFKTSYQGKGTLVLVNNAGQNILQQDASIVSGNNVITFSTNNIAAGTYYMLLKDRNGQLIGDVQKLVKQ
ncbi:MAG: hypothetical protein QM726_07655 [Chitinophagaceae bacterium]